MVTIEEYRRRIEAKCSNCPHEKPASSHLSQQEFDTAIHAIASYIHLLDISARSRRG